MASAPPPVVFEVTLVVPGEMRACMRAQGVFEDWLHGEADSDDPRPISELPATEMDMQSPEVCNLTLRWIELEARNAWDAIQRSTAIVEQVLPELLRTRQISVEAKLQAGDPDDRRPVGQ